MINFSSRCYCCETHEQETMSHIFLTAPIAQELWDQFAYCASVSLDGNLQQVITAWWRTSNKPKLKIIFQQF